MYLHTGPHVNIRLKARRGFVQALPSGHNVQSMNAKITRVPSNEVRRIVEDCRAPELLSCAEMEDAMPGVTDMPVAVPPALHLHRK